MMLNSLRLTCISFIAFSAMLTPLYAQRIATLEVDLKKRTPDKEIHVQVDLDAITALPDSVIRLIEVKGNKQTPVAYQVENNGKRVLHWLVKPSLATSIFALEKGKPLKPADHIRAIRENGELTISNGNKNLLRYNYKTVYPPKGIDTAFKRSGFIHPLWSPHGQELTRIQAPDHYHHYGLWNPWTHVVFEGDTVDFWNLKDRKGTVRFVDFVAVNAGPVYAEYQTLHDHVVFKKDGTEKVALNELQSVRIFQPQKGQDYYIADITIQLNCATDEQVLLKEYRYGGLGWRASEKWNKENSETLTSEGKTRKDADGTKARWVILQGKIDDDYAGAVMMSYPTNYNYPEPLRIWPENMNGRGDVYANFSPTKDKDWLLEKGKTYILKYRFLVYNGHASKERAEAAWGDFASPPVVKIKLNQLNSN